MLLFYQLATLRHFRRQKLLEALHYLFQYKVVYVVNRLHLLKIVLSGFDLQHSRVLRENV